MKANKQQKQVSVRLNASIRQQIIKDILIHRHGKDIRKLNKKFSTLANNVYHSVLDALIPEAKEVFIGFPKGIVESATSINISYPYDSGSHYTKTANLCFGNQLSRLGYAWDKTPGHQDARLAIESVLSAAGMFAEIRNIPYQSRHTLSNGPLTDRVDKLTDERTKLWESLIGDAKELRSVLTSFTTLKKLEENWPEIQAFTTKHRVYEGEKTPKKTKPKMQLPAIPYANLNDRFWLPSEKAAKDAAT